MAKKHKDLEFHVESKGRGSKVLVFKTFEEATAAAVAASASTGETVYLDVLTWSKAAAKAWAGDHGVEVYEEDPEASVHERIEVNAVAQGRIA
jgi:hypothetical protein